jgi:hypothetical protein
VSNNLKDEIFEWGIIIVVAFIIIKMCESPKQDNSSEATNIDALNNIEGNSDITYDSITEATNLSNNKAIPTQNNSSKDLPVTTFKPVSATLTDELGNYTSDNFDSSNLFLVDNRSSLEVTIAGDKFTLFPIGYGKDTYQCEGKNQRGKVKFVAYRSSKTSAIYSIICTTLLDGKKIVIKYKPE